MSNRLRQVQAVIHSLSPAEVEVWIVIDAEEVTPTTEVRGKLVGPRCMNLTTVEVAYPLRPFSRHPDRMPPLTRRVIIPEPSLWEPQHRMVYSVSVELWQDGRCCDHTDFNCGLRMAAEGREERAEGHG
jgi:hypothetical protein